jgi:hypothetical protein
MKEESEMTNDYHTDPRALLIEAAERSGLLKEIAHLLWFVEKHNLETCCNGGTCAPCELIAQLVEAFEEDVGSLPYILAEDIWGDGLDVSPHNDAELAEFEAFFNTNINQSPPPVPEGVQPQKGE